MPEIEIFPAELLNQGGNLGIQYMLIFLLIFAGGKVADLGIKVMKVEEK